MTLEQVVDQYARHIERILTRADKQGRQLTAKERRGIFYYRAAGVAVQRLVDQ